MLPRTSIVAAAIALFGSIALADIADAKVHIFKGTRDQVRGACKAIGGLLTEGASSTSCVNGPKNTAVDCDNAGNCIGTTPNRTTAGSGEDMPGLLLGTAGKAKLP